MTELEMFKKLFGECSIWRGGADDLMEVDGHTYLAAHMAVELRDGRTKYWEFQLEFDPNGEWVGTKEIR